MKTIVIHRVTSSKFGNRMKYTKEKTGPYHTGFSHFLCHCITDFFLSVDIQIVSLVIYARFLYHCPITGNLDKNRHSAYIQLYINTLQITKTINTLFPSLQTTRLFYAKTGVK